MLVESNRVAFSKEYSSLQIFPDLLSDLGFIIQAILNNGSLGSIPKEIDTINPLYTQKLIETYNIPAHLYDSPI